MAAPFLRKTVRGSGRGFSFFILGAGPRRLSGHMRSLGVHSLGAPLSSKPNSFSVIVRSTSGSRITLREFDDFLCDKSRGWVANFQMQSATRCHEGSGHGLNDLRLKGLMSEIWSYRHTSP